MALPQELRDRIFQFLVGPQIWPHFICECCSLEKLGRLPYSDHVMGLEGGSGNMPYHECFDGTPALGIAAPSAKSEPPEPWNRDPRTSDFGPLPEDTCKNIGRSYFDANSIATLFQVSKDVRDQIKKLIWGPFVVKRFNRRFILGHMIKYCQYHT